ncbi:MAG: carbohydrate ABC transporter permease, partial [Mycetocola sp.]
MLKPRTLTGRIIVQVILTILILPFAFPLLVMIQGSLAGAGWGNYAAVLAVPELPLFFRNSIIITAATIAIVYVVALIAAFGFSKLHLRG